ncbi:MAG TPA: hypothetical protein VE619_05630, partial [Nitrososphaeraceae archaeon]|nr:hypothetical protein [Nitrososphaeraceae archaeon]
SISSSSVDCNMIADSNSNNNNNNNDNSENNMNNGNNNNNNNNSLTRIRRTRRRGLGIPMHPVSKIEIAEMTKTIENAYRYLQIAFAEDLYLYCQANNINFSELRDALNTKWNVSILEPREGIGGHCLPKDTRMFLQSSKSIKSKIVTAAVEVDQEYRRYRQQLARNDDILSSQINASESKHN